MDEEIEQNLAFDFGEFLQYPDSELEDNEPDQLLNSSIMLSWRSGQLSGCCSRDPFLQDEYYVDTM